MPLAGCERHAGLQLFAALILWREAVSFVIARNITAQAGNRSIYVRITKPNNEVLTNGGTFVYENRNLEYSAKKDIEYNGEATSVTVYWDVNEFLSKGTYRVSVFADGHNIGNASFNYEK